MWIRKIFHGPTLCLLVCWITLFATVTVAVSFQVMLHKDLAHRFCADFYVLPGNDAKEQTIAGDTWAEIILDNNFADAEAIQKRTVRINNQSIQVMGIPFRKSLYKHIWKKPPAVSTVNETDFMEIEPVYVSESFARHFKLFEENFFPVPTSSGERSAVITGIFKSRTTKEPTIIVERSTFSQWFKDYRAIYLAVLLKNKEEQEKIIDQLNKNYAEVAFYPQKDFVKILLRPTQLLLGITYFVQAAMAVFLLILGSYLRKKFK